MSISDSTMVSLKGGRMEIVVSPAERTWAFIVAEVAIGRPRKPEAMDFSAIMRKLEELYERGIQEGKNV